jgi:hypothetical protein
MNARYYIGSIGRYASADTIVPDPTNPQSLNRLSYVRNNPINLIDPTGNFGICFQQGTADQANIGDEDNAAKPLSQICQDLNDKGYFGESGEARIFGNDIAGLEAAIAYLVEMMALYPDEEIVVLGYSYGGGGALEFTHLLSEANPANLAAAGFSPDLEIPQGVLIDALVLIDPVALWRAERENPYAKYVNHESIPPSVDNALNLYATRLDGFWEGTPWASGLKNIEGALNIGMQGTNHCSISYACPNKIPVLGWPAFDDEAGKMNPRTLYAIKGWLHELQLR